MRAAALLALSIVVVEAPPLMAQAEERCLSFSGTSDAIRKSNAVEAALESLRKAIEEWKVETRTPGPFTATPERPQPVPYWRSSVRQSLFLPPDVISDTTHTICWRGVFSPVVCTSGTKLCWSVGLPGQAGTLPPLPEASR